MKRRLHNMKNEKTMDERLKTYAIHQDDSLDRHLPKTKPKTLIILAVCSPLLALFSWTLLIYFALASD
jgi:hypothetical protein